MGWWIAGGLFALWCLFCWYHNSAEGRHRHGDRELSPVGKVWLHDGTWWTFTRRHYERTPREFDRRSNPLDHEEVLDYEEPIPSRMRRVYKEVEY